MHGDLQKSAKDSTLEHSLFAAFTQSESPKAGVGMNQIVGCICH